MLCVRPCHERARPWCEQGVSSWDKMKNRGANRKGKLSEYFSSECHRKALKACARFCDPLCHVDMLIDRAGRNSTIQEAKDVVENEEVVEVLLNVAKTLACHDIAFRGDGNDDDCNFRENCCSCSKILPFA